MFKLHGISHYKLSFTRSRWYYGMTRWNDKITVSKYLVDHSYADAKMVLLHEIAHALNYKKNGSTIHDAGFYYFCKKIGAIPEELYAMKNFDYKYAKYVGTCKKCGKKYYYYKKPRRELACTSCCKKYPCPRNTVLDIVDNVDRVIV